MHRLWPVALWAASGCIWIPEDPQTKQVGCTDDCGEDTGEPDEPPDTHEPVDEDHDGYSVDDDCDDTDPAVHPGAEERCDDSGRDSNCDGHADLGAPGTRAWYPDSDGDSFGDAASGEELCEDPGDGRIEDGRDCDDDNGSVHPGATERCETSYDDNCDGDTLGADPPAPDCNPWYVDRDGDGYGPRDPSDGDSGCQCEGDESFPVDNALDCDDEDPNRHPDSGTCGWSYHGPLSVTADTLTISAAGSSGTRFGMQVLVGDYCASSFDDIVVSGLYDGSDPDGDVWLFCGPFAPGDTLAPSDADLVWTSADLPGEEMRSEDLGTWLSPMGDTDDDGVQEFAAVCDFGRYYGTYLEDQGGAVVLDASAASGVGTSQSTYILTGSYGDRLDWVEGLGDLDGDGFDDVVVSTANTLYLGLGPATAGPDLGDVSWSFWQDFGRSGHQGVRADGGDLDGDGYADLVVSDNAAADAVYVHLGGATASFYAPWMTYGASSGGLDLGDVGVGDWNGDGTPDLAITGWSSSSSDPALHVLWGVEEGTASGPDGVWQTRSTLTSANYTGVYLSDPVDLDLDGIDDLLVGRGGTTYALFGQLTAHTAWDGTTLGGAAGAYVEAVSSIAHAPAVGDLDGDGQPDVVVGSSQSDNRGTSAGSWSNDGQVWGFFGG